MNNKLRDVSVVITLLVAIPLMLFISYQLTYMVLHSMFYWWRE